MTTQLLQPRRIRRLLFFLFFVVLALGIVWWQRAPLLRGVARLLIVADQPVQADAIVILGGGLETRPHAAARLYREGWAPKILVMQPEKSDITGLDLVLDYGALTHKLLLKENVPESAITMLEPEVTSTVEEARVLAQWVAQHKPRRLLVPTDLFHTRRARWILRRILQDDTIELQMIAVPLRRYSADNWWQTEPGVIDFQNELIKSALYRWRY